MMIRRNDVAMRKSNDNIGLLMFLGGSERVHWERMG